MSAQSRVTRDAFKLLPSDKIYGLSLATRDSLLKGKTYYPADNDSSSALAYNYGNSTVVKDYMYVSMAYETGQRATGMIEIRIIKTAKGENLVLVSASAGVWQANYRQTDFTVYLLKKAKTIEPYKKKLFLSTDESLFIKPGVPDSVKQLILNNSNLAFDFSKKNPVLALNSNYLFDNPVTKKWLKGDTIEFRWTGNEFMISGIGWEREL